jgi:hypothetical protein
VPAVYEMRVHANRLRFCESTAEWAVRGAWFSELQRDWLGIAVNWLECALVPLRSRGKCIRGISGCGYADQLSNRIAHGKSCSTQSSHLTFPPGFASSSSRLPGACATCSAPTSGMKRHWK